MKIYVVGIGAGSADGMTFEARNVLEKAGVIVGYTVYAELVKKLFPEKEYFVSAMKQEAERCRKAVEMAADGRNVAVVCSGDAGVYGMASLVYEIAAGYENVEVSVVAGVSAMLSLGRKSKNVLNVRRRLISRYVCTIRQVKNVTII